MMMVSKLWGARARQVWRRKRVVSSVSWLLRGRSRDRSIRITALIRVRWEHQNYMAVTALGLYHCKGPCNPARRSSADAPSLCSLPRSGGGKTRYSIFILVMMRGGEGGGEGRRLAKCNNNYSLNPRAANTLRRSKHHASLPCLPLVSLMSHKPCLPLDQSLHTSAVILISCYTHEPSYSCASDKPAAPRGYLRIIPHGETSG